MPRFQNFIKTFFHCFSMIKISTHPKARLVFQSKKHFVWGKILYDTQRKDDRKNPYAGCQYQQRKNKRGNEFCLSQKMKFIRLIKSLSALLDTFQGRFLTRTVVVHLPQHQPALTDRTELQLLSTKNVAIVFTKRSDFDLKKSKLVKNIHGKKMAMYFCNNCPKS